MLHKPWRKVHSADNSLIVICQSCFQRFIDYVLRGFDFVFAYIDDLLVASRDDVEHHHHLALVFERLSMFGVTLNPSKCCFGRTAVDFLGHEISENGIRPLEAHVHAIRDFPPPTTTRQVQRFLGMMNFYRRFIPNCASVVMPPTILTTGPRGPRELSPDALQAFSKIKSLLADATLLAHPSAWHEAFSDGRCFKNSCWCCSPSRSTRLSTTTRRLLKEVATYGVSL